MRKDQGRPIDRSSGYGSCQDTNIIHEPFHQVLVLVLGVARHGELTLSANLGGGDFDFELVIEFTFRRRLQMQVSDRSDVSCLGEGEGAYL